MKLNKNEQNYLLTILFKSYILQSVICSGIILVCTVSLDMGLTWVLDRYVEHYYLIYRGLYVYMVGLILWVVCILYLTYKLLKKVVNYVYELQAATGKLFDKSVDYIELSPELSEIAININRLKQEAENNARLAQENEQRKNDLIMYLAHDLKTPLSSVIGYLTLLHDDEQQISQELREKYLSISLDKAERLEDLINEFFEITRFNLSNITLQYSNINLTRLLEQLIYEFKPILKEKNLKCTLNSTSDIMLHCDANKIQRVFDNLLRNAVIYSYTDTEVAITTELQENTIVITFENFGNPIAEEKLKLIFEQFYRVDTSRNTTSGGAGLGLAIAKHIVELHKGTIVAHSQERINVFMEHLNNYLQNQGYENTILYDPSGYDVNALTTVSDLKSVSTHLLEKQWFRDIVSKSNYTATLPDGSTQTWRNTNTFLDQTSEYYNENVKGIKTGSLSNDYNLVVLYQQHGKEFLICSLGSQSDSSRYDDVNYILKTIDESDYLTK